MRNIGNNIIILILLLTLQSCGLFNRVFKSSNKFKEVSAVTLHKDNKTVIEDKSKTVIEESADTTITTKPRTDKSKISVSNLKDIKDLTLFSNDLYDIKQTFDTVSNTLNTTVENKPQSHNLKFNRKITKDNNIKTTSDTKVDSTANKTIKDKQSVKQKEPINVFWAVVLGLGVIAAFYFIFKK